MSLETYRFNVGKFECIAVNDGMFTYTARQYFSNAPEDQLARVVDEHHLDPARIPSPFTCLVVNTGAHQVLVDTGGGNFAPGVGRHLQNLRAKGVAPEEIDTVVLTHGHPDHIGGNTDGDGRPIYRNARHVMFHDEWTHWTDEASLARLPGAFVAVARKNLPPLCDQLDLLDREAEVVPGIRALRAPGHTPGHMALAVTSGDDELLYISDAALHPIHLEQPDWHTAFDLDAEQALASKRHLFDRAAAERALVLAFHFHPFPSLGHVVRRGRGWQWQPIEAGGHTAQEDPPAPVEGAG